MVKSEVLSSAISCLQEQVDQLAMGIEVDKLNFGSAITELQKAVDRLTGGYVDLKMRVRELENAVRARPPAAAKAATPEIVTFPSGWAITHYDDEGEGTCVFTRERGLVPCCYYGKWLGETDVAWFASERDAQQVVDLLGLRDVRVARLYRDTLGEVT